MAGPNTKHYDVSDGPMAQLLRIVRDGMGMTVSQLYERATSDGVGVHSRRHMKGLPELDEEDREGANGAREERAGEDRQRKEPLVSPHRG